MKTLPTILIILLFPLLLVGILVSGLVMLFQPKSEDSYKYLTYNSDEEDIIASVCWDDLEEKILSNNTEVQDDAFFHAPKPAIHNNRRNFKYSI
jgi:hypothetical protein